MSNDGYKVNIESILLGYYIRYTRLQELTEETLVNGRYSDSDTIDIYIDLNDMMKKLYTTDIYSNKQFTITSSVINLAAHMREFYWSRYHVNTNIYLVYATDETHSHKQFYPTFGETNIKEMRNYQKINDIIESQLDMVKILCAYINDVYFIKKKSDFGVFVYNNILLNHIIPAIIISKDKYIFQIPAICDNAIVYRPKKYDGHDISYSVTYNNVLQTYCSKTSSSKVMDQLKAINPRLTSLLLSLNGLPCKRVLSIYNITTAVGRLYNAISNHKIINDYNSDIDYVYNQLDLYSKIDSTNFKYRFNAIDIVYQHRLYSNMAESKDMSWLINLNDPDTVRNINNKYFIDNPLDLNSL